MAEYVTIIGPKLLYEEVRRCIMGSTAGEYALEGFPTDWSSLVVRKGKASLAFSVMRFVEAQDPFCCEVLHLANLARNAEGVPKKKRDKVEKFVASAEMILGVVGTPRLDSIERGEDAIYSVAETIEGIVFTGSEFLDPDGNVLLTLPEPEE